MKAYCCYVPVVDSGMRILRVKNFFTAISVVGFEQDTDFRRGNGTFNKVDRTMKIRNRGHSPRVIIAGALVNYKLTIGIAYTIWSLQLFEIQLSQE